MNRIVIDERTCRKCNLCVEICPNRILMRTDDTISANVNRIDVCLKCGQCMAICPAKSISVDGLSYSKDFFDLPEMQIKPEYFSNLISTRRAIRNFKEKTVEKELLNEIVKAISFAPPGFPPLKYDLVVVQNSTVIRQALPYMIQLYDFLVNAMNNPIKRIFIKKEVGELRFRTLKEHLIPLLKMSLPDLKNGTEDTLTRNAPAMILFLADTTGEDITEDIHVAATFGILSAHALGLGASIMDIIPPAINKKKELRKMFGLTENQEVITSIILGYPKYTFQRGIKRQVRNIRWI